ncbi:MAG: hypothetical protein GWO08_18400 [Gammaproteobacteria bacterium]|nr:hypothetical protein [candidate division Zixibacteria bacterium]NIR95535.1 hypothetical protein [Gammaproteobacteria bacterium]NIR66252.1 hypothetical protein [candidate division Zixibacteria bacterium]NIS47855.1 hypothetical protein [candidate division Zixibacteria bacterium]NIU15958.1 hypothetical protein [candidate division Zixibacteria bacterium]
MADTSENTPVYQELELLNAILIGFMMGVYEVMGKGGAQAIINMAGKKTGQEILRFARDHSIEINTLNDLKRFLIDSNLMGEMDFYTDEHATFVRIVECKTCPKKVGHYSFDGTACPWGGVLSGAISEILGAQYSTSPKLSPGQQCVLEIKKSRTDPRN